MKQFFHSYPTCPCCHEPNLNGSVLEVLDPGSERYKCSFCNVYFFKNIDFSAFPKTWNLMKDGKEDYELHVADIPLLWKINSNIIEKSYFNWLDGEITGKYLVNWPWDEVKFLPLLVSNFALENPGKKIAVITDCINTYHMDNEVQEPNVISLFNDLFYLDGEVNEYPEDIKDEMRGFKRNHVLERRNKFHCHVKIVKKSFNDDKLDIENDISVDTENCTLRKCKNRIMKKMEYLYGKNCIRAIKWKERMVWERNTYNPDGYFDISIEERPEWGCNIKFDRFSYWNIITNINRLYRINLKLPPIIISNDTIDVHNSYETNQIFFISDSLEPNKIFITLDTIGPDLVIFPRVDDFIEEGIIFNSPKGREFLNFLNKTEKTLLMFSVKPDSRHLYEIGVDGGFTDEYNVIAHTWDSDFVIKKLMNKESQNNLISAGSSSFNRIESYETPHSEYIQLKCLDAVEEVIPQILKTVGNNNRIKRFFDYLLRTSLYINCECEKTNFRRGDWNFSNIMDHIYENDNEIYHEIIEPFNKCYLNKEEPKNPIINKINELLADFVEKENLITLIVVSFYEKKGTEIILQEKGFRDYIPEHIKICTWNEIDSVILESEDDKDFYVISAIKPSIKYQLYKSSVNKFIFIGSSRNLEYTKIIIDYRLIEKNARPLHKLLPEEDAPELLKSTLDQLPSDDIQNVISNMEFEETIKLPVDTDSSTPVENHTTHHMKINAYENAILAVDETGNGMFLPIGRYVSFKHPDNDSIEEIKVNKSKIDDLTGKEIIIDDHGFYTSYKMIFTKFVVEMGENIPINTPLYRWNGFKDLINSAFEWLRLLRKVLSIIQNDFQVSESEAKEKLANILVTTDIHARDVNYIKNHWLAEPNMLSTTSGPIQVFEIEHPRGFQDLIKIYNKIKVEYPAINIEKYDARNTYTAAITFQRIRRNFLRGENIRIEYKYLHRKLQEQIRMIIKKSLRFKISSISVVKLRKEVYPMEIIEDFHVYLES